MTSTPRWLPPFQYFRGLECSSPSPALTFVILVACLPLVGAGDNEMVVCGMALGYADETALVNTFQTTRVSGQDFTHWVD